MITQFNQSRYGYLSRIMILPVAFVLFCAISLYAKRAPSGQMDMLVLPANGQPLVLMIDAGHGGSDAGAKSADGKFSEKDFSLAIAKKLKEEAEKAGIKVLMSRVTDVYMTVQERSAMNLLHKPTLFVSIHVAVGPEPVDNSIGGAEAYIGSKKQETRIPSIELGNNILKALEPVIKVNTPVKERNNAGIWVLDQSPCPGVIVHCGYMSNEKDVAFISDPANQQKIADHILKGIVSYHANSVQKENAAEAEIKSVELPTKADTIPDELQKKTFTKLDISPSFPGGTVSWMKYLKENLRYPEEAMKKKVSGTVIVKFIVDVDGGITYIGPVTGPAELRAECIRIVKESGKWLPGIHNGKKVRAYHSQPIVFKLDHT